MHAARGGGVWGLEYARKKPLKYLLICSEYGVKLTRKKSSIKDLLSGSPVSAFITLSIALTGPTGQPSDGLKPLSFLLSSTS